MATPQRPTFSTGRASRRRSRRPAHTEDWQYISPHDTSNQFTLAVPTTPKAPNSAAPAKCKANMTSADFRTWRRTMIDWLRMNRTRPSDIPPLVRMHCEPDLQRAIDARYSEARWNALDAEETADTIAKLVLQASNEAATWADFFSITQHHDENVNNYFVRCASKAIECEFKCPSCMFDLTEYFMMRKVIVGLRDLVLKRQVFHMCNSFSDVDALKAFCCSFEAAKRDSETRASFEKPASAAAVEPERDIEGASACATTGSGKQKAQSNQPARRKCPNCGGEHAPGKDNCPAKSMICFKCQKLGHIKGVCRSRAPTDAKGAATTAPSASGVVAASPRQDYERPTATVYISSEEATAPRGVATEVVLDTGADVCVAGPNTVDKLETRPALMRGAGLKDIANLDLHCEGKVVLWVSAGGRTTKQDVYIIKSVNVFYLSLRACKALGFIPPNWPEVPLHPELTLASTTTAPETTKPAEMPLLPLEENIPRLENWLLKHFSATTFNTERSPLPVMAGEPHHIHLLPGATPHACHTPASIPKHWEAEVKAQLAEDVKRGVIQEVPPGQATEWCARMVVVAKKSGQPRRTVDYQKLNTACKRETHHTPTPFDMVSGVPQHSYKTVADAFWGFHQVELDEESRRLTTFITPWGRFQYRRTPMGHCSASDAYTRRFDDTIKDVPRKYKCVDDTLLYDAGIEDAFWHTYDFLATCAAKGITLKPEKFQFCRREVDFVGFRMGWEEYKPSEGTLTAVRSFRMPDTPTLTDIRSWYGFVNQLAPFLATSSLMAPFRELLKKNSGKRVFWDEVLQEKFKKVQETICSLARDGLTYYDKSRPTVALTDWSKDGIGFAILQQYCHCQSSAAPFCCRDGWRIALCGSRHLTPAEAGYAAVEGEALAVVWCLKKARLLLLGCPNLVVVTDHRPLVKLFSDRALKDIVNPRLFRLKEKTLQYRFVIKYSPGKRNCAADFLSRFPALRVAPDEDDIDLDSDIEAAVAAATVADIGEAMTMDEDTVATAAAGDPTYQLLHSRVTNNDWPPQKAQEMACLRPFYNVRDRLSLSDDLVVYSFEDGCLRLVIPEPLRPKVATNLHAAHQGLDSMLRRARQTVYWPGMEGDLQHHRSRCTTCELNAPSQLDESLSMAPTPEYPFQHTVVDMFQIDGRNYMAYADRLTGWLEIAYFPNGTPSWRLINRLRQYFTRWGAPEELSMDGGTNLVSDEMNTFLKKWGVRTRLASAYHPQSNGRAEAAVKSAKRIVRDNLAPDGSLDCDSVSAATLQYLNTPLREINKSPAQLASGRQLRDGVPTHRFHYHVDHQWKQTLRDREAQMTRVANQLMTRSTPRHLPPITPGTPVRIQHNQSNVWDRTGTVVESLPHRQYRVRMDGSGRISIRNRKHIKPLRDAGGDEAPPDETPLGEGTNTARPTSSRRREQPTADRTPRPRRDPRPPTWLAEYSTDTPE